MIDASYMELHLGVLQNRLSTTAKQMHICNQKIAMKEGEVLEEGVKGLDIDIETEELELKKLEKQTETLEDEVKAYEGKVLELTKL
jgi:hypothetical protein